MRGFEVCAPQLPGRLQPLLESVSRVCLWGRGLCVCAHRPGARAETTRLTFQNDHASSLPGAQEEHLPGRARRLGLECLQRPVAPQHLPSVSPERLREITPLSLLCLQTP